MTNDNWPGSKAHTAPGPFGKARELTLDEFTRMNRWSTLSSHNVLPLAFQADENGGDAKRWIFGPSHNKYVQNAMKQLETIRAAIESEARKEETQRLVDAARREAAEATRQQLDADYAASLPFSETEVELAWTEEQFKDNSLTKSEILDQREHLLYHYRRAVQEIRGLQVDMARMRGRQGYIMKPENQEAMFRGRDPKQMSINDMQNALSWAKKKIKEMESKITNDLFHDKSGVFVLEPKPETKRPPESEAHSRMIHILNSRKHVHTNSPSTLREIEESFKLAVLGYLYALQPDIPATPSTNGDDA